MNSADFKNGEYGDVPPKKGLQAFFRVYSTWALSPEWFRQECWKDVGCKTLQEYLNQNWDGGGEANDLLALLWTWQHGDVTRYFPEDAGDLAKTLGRVKARCLIVPVSTDQYFPPEDSEQEVKALKDGILRVVPSVWGHLAGGGNGTKEDTEFMVREIGEFLKLR
ncbi:hypothetical protein HII31_03959 [Pseudocercospora fuligena]|uniref:AB hydrolase-1 domain-containing protein n=1 Tax=Pseudocercospora fuligena TaxID=685502 RepID=A0A8H6VLG0_9PEZI|nr:hypothetical protein HII31_03959 [Pseudocercospora fuligena]